MAAKKKVETVETGNGDSKGNNPKIADAIETLREIFNQKRELFTKEFAAGNFNRASNVTSVNNDIANLDRMEKRYDSGFYNS